MQIGNTLGTYLYYDRSYIQMKIQTLARILVYLDTKEGLEEKITLQWKNFTWVQILDYKGIPFYCRRCHKVGHVFKECPLVKKAMDSPAKSAEANGQSTPRSDYPPMSMKRTSACAVSPQDAECLHKTPSPPMTGSRAATENARKAGTFSNPISSAFV